MMQMLYVNTALSLCLSPMLPQMIIYVLSHWFHFCPPSQISIFSSPRENRRLVLHFCIGSLQAAEVRVAVKWIISPDSICMSCLRFPFSLCLWVKLLQFCVDGVSGVIVLMSWLLCSHSKSHLRVLAVALIRRCQGEIGTQLRIPAQLQEFSSAEVLSLLDATTHNSAAPLRISTMETFTMPPKWATSTLLKDKPLDPQRGKSIFKNKFICVLEMKCSHNSLSCRSNVWFCIWHFQREWKKVSKGEKQEWVVVVVHVWNPNTEAEAGGFTMSSRLAWAIEWDLFSKVHKKKATERAQ